MPKSNGKGSKDPRKIYLDYAAGVSPNASSIHTEGVLAKRKLENARASVAEILGARPNEIIFTSGGTESNNIAIQGLVWAQKNSFFQSLGPSLRGASPSKKNFSAPIPHIITTNIEHPSVLETFKMLERRGLAKISVVPVESNGIVDPKKIKKAMKNNTVLVSVQYANNEIGTVQPIREIAKEIRHFQKQNKNSKIYFHTDAVQAANYLELNVARLGVDMLTLSGSKIEGAGRVGVLYRKKTVPLTAIFSGGDQEMGIRPGTENLPAIEEFSLALEEAQKIKEKESARLIKLRNYFFQKLQHSNILKNVGMFVNGDLENRLPNNVSITFPKIPSDLLIIELAAKGIMASSKSACKSSRAEGSYVIEAIRPGANPEIGAVRFSLGRDTTKSDIDYTVNAVSLIIKKLEKWYN